MVAVLTPSPRADRLNADFQESRRKDGAVANRRPSRVVRIARWSAEHRWRAVLGWVAFVIICVAVGGMAGTVSQTDAQQAVGEWGRAEKMLADAHFTDPAVENVLITARSGPLDRAAATAAGTEAGRRLRALPEVATVSEPVTSPGGTAVLVRAEMTGDPQDAVDRVQPLVDATAAVQAAHPALRVEEVGGGTIEKALAEDVRGRLPPGRGAQPAGDARRSSSSRSGRCWPPRCRCCSR